MLVQPQADGKAKGQYGNRAKMRARCMPVFRHGFFPDDLGKENPAVAPGASQCADRYLYGSLIKSGATECLSFF